MLGRRILEIVLIVVLLWYCLSLKFLLGFGAGLMLAGEVWASMKGAIETMTADRRGG